VKTIVPGTKGIHNCATTLSTYPECWAAVGGLPVEER